MVRTTPLIAIVDDDRFVRTALQRLVASDGFAVEVYPSGDAFLQSVEDHEPDCVVLDLHMPQISGFEVQRRLGAGHARIPVVVITGNDSPEARRRALDGGAKSYLCKPVDQKTLLDAIRAAMFH